MDNRGKNSVNKCKLTTRFLVQTAELDEVGKLLYSVYIEESGWRFGVNTPHKIRIDSLPDDSLVLVDDYHYITKWIGAFADNKLIGCLRVFHRVGQEQWVQTQFYHKKKDKLNRILDKEPGLIEASRAAVHKEYRGADIFLLEMFKLLFLHAYQNDISVFFTTRVPSLINLFHELKIPLMPGIQFKYEEQDPGAVVPFLCRIKTNDVFNVLHNIQTFENKKLTSGSKFDSELIELNCSLNPRLTLPCD